MFCATNSDSAVGRHDEIARRSGAAPCATNAVAVVDSSLLGAGWRRTSRRSDLADSQPASASGDVAQHVPTGFTVRLLTRYSELRESGDASIIRSHTRDYALSHELRQRA